MLTAALRRRGLTTVSRALLPKLSIALLLWLAAVSLAHATCTPGWFLITYNGGHPIPTGSYTKNIPPTTVSLPFTPGWVNYDNSGDPNIQVTKITLDGTVETDGNGNPLSVPVPFLVPGVDGPTTSITTMVNGVKRCFDIFWRLDSHGCPEVVITEKNCPPPCDEYTIEIIGSASSPSVDVEFSLQNFDGTQTQVPGGPYSVGTHTLPAGSGGMGFGAVSVWGITRLVQPGQTKTITDGTNCAQISLIQDPETGCWKLTVRFVPCNCCDGITATARVMQTPPTVAPDGCCRWWIDVTQTSNGCPIASMELVATGSAAATLGTGFTTSPPGSLNGTTVGTAIMCAPGVGMYTGSVVVKFKDASGNVICEKTIPLQCMGQIID